MKKILTVIGARPQFIKASVVSRAIVQTSSLSEIVVHTGQHYDTNMSDVFFEEFEMRPPDYHFEIGGTTHGRMTGDMLAEIEKILLAETPDAALVYGDTNSTLAGALAAVKLHIPVAHVEAGLRSFNIKMPEEINRILTDRISRWLFTPTENAYEQLRKEGVCDSQIIPVGDVMYDVALHYGAKVSDRAGVLEVQGLGEKDYILVTVHRAENTDNIQRLETIVKALNEVSQKIPIVWPLHPRTRHLLHNVCHCDDLHPDMRLIDPVGYLNMVQLEKHAALIATDSGGVQKEAFFHQVPCVTLRNETEWTELVDTGWNRLAPPTSVDAVRDTVLASVGTDGELVEPYGAGNAAQLIVDTLSVSIT